MEKHINLIGILYIAFSVMGLIAASLVFIIIAGGGFISGDEEAMYITGIVATVLSGLITFFSIPGIIGGWGLLKKKKWARIVLLILGALNLLNIPFGTVLGGYTLWALLQDESMKWFE
ncbi:MAG TPA: hypothetical protein PLP19_06655 [bacterium]|nr:hypothetical protein [bacterium]HPN43150.1 hypothetical protein [bacterium]